MGKIQGRPKEEIQTDKLRTSGIYLRGRRLSVSSSPNPSSTIAFNHYSTCHIIMQSIELYRPGSPNLHLTSFAATNSLSEDLNPLNYQLTTDDFITLVQQDGQLLYTLDPATTTALFWALHRLAKFIVRAASHGLYNDSSIPFASKGYIPQIYFDRIGMQRPDILTIQDHHVINPLCGYTTRENLTAWYRDFQTMGRLAVQWIQVARRQALQLGPGTGWDWEARHGSRLEFPQRRLITMRGDGNDSHSDNSPEGSEVGLGSWEGLSEASSEGEKIGRASCRERVC